jgi:GT2 family glycosyltransferase
MLSVVVVNWNGRDHLRACLASLRAQSYHDLEIIVVDNGSSDESAQMVTREFPECVLLRESVNRGFAEGCNRGIIASRGDWVAMLNNDCVADPEWARAMADAAARSDRRLGMLQSLMLFLDRPGIVNSTGIELTRLGGGRDRDRERARHEIAAAPAAIFCPTAGAAAYRRTMLDAVRLSAGYFDAGHFMYFEDLDLGWRARLAGWEARFVPEAIVHHKWHGSVDRHGASWLVVLSGVNRVRTLLKNASPSMLVRTLPLTIWELGEIVWHGGFGALRRLARAGRDSLALRREVSSMRQVPRRAVERAWQAKA